MRANRRTGWLGVAASVADGDVALAGRRTWYVDRQGVRERDDNGAAERRHGGLAVAAATRRGEGERQPVDGRCDGGEVRCRERHADTASSSSATAIANAVRASCSRLFTVPTGRWMAAATWAI